MLLAYVVVNSPATVGNNAVPVAATLLPLMVVPNDVPVLVVGTEFTFVYVWPLKVNVAVITGLEATNVLPVGLSVLF